MSKYVISDDTGRYLQGLAIGCNAENYKSQTEWTTTEFYAYKSENKDEAQAIIDFITNVIDWELGEQLTTEPAQI